MGFSNILIWNSLLFSPFKQKLSFCLAYIFWKEAESRLNSWIQIHTVQIDKDFQTTDESDPNLWTPWNSLLVKDKSNAPIGKILSQPASKLHSGYAKILEDEKLYLWISCSTTRLHW